MTPLASAARRLRRRIRPRPPDADARRAAMSPEDRRYLETLYDDSVPLPEGAEDHLTEDNPRLRELRTAYAGLDLPVLTASRWTDRAVDRFLDLRHFRGETLITWHYREERRLTELKYFVLLRYVEARDTRGFLRALTEDGAFGCWTFSYEGYGRVSRDLLQSANEIRFLDEALGLSARDRLAVLDVGAGYGRLAHRLVEAHPVLDDYCCVDAIPESTFLSEYYLAFRGCGPTARVVPLHRLDRELQAGGFDLAVNIHSFSECTYAAVAWWLELLRDLRVPRLLLVPNEPTEPLSLEADGSRRALSPMIEAAGYSLDVREPVVDDPAVRELVGVHDHFHLFSLDCA